MAEYLIQGETLNQIADAIRTKTGERGEMTPVEMPEKIESIKEGIKGLWEQIQDGTLTEWVDDEITEMNLSPFRKYFNLKKIKCNNLKKITLDQAFQQCVQLTSVDLPNLTSIASDVFFGCSITHLNLPLLESLPGGYTLSNNDFTSVILPSLKSLGGASFFGCQLLITLDLPQLEIISAGTGLFSSCNSLSALILRGGVRVDLTSNCLASDNGIANGTGYIYVPAALLEEYKSATNWSIYATQFRALEDYTVDGTITGELDETKIAEVAE